MKIVIIGCGKIGCTVIESLLGRLEIYPIIIALSPSSWSRKK